MTKSLAEGIATQALVDPEHDRMPAASKHTRTWESFRWGSIVAAIVAGFYAGAYAHRLVDELFAVDTRGWGLLGVVVWITCTAVAVNAAWLSVRVLGFFVDETLNGPAPATREQGSRLDPKGNDDR